MHTRTSFIGMILLGLFLTVVLSCEEPKSCRKNKKFCTTREKLRTKCPCTCAPDVNLIDCCENQQFEQEVCRTLCTYNLKNSYAFKTMYATCFNDFFKIQYCATNGYQNSTECCLENGVSKDEPGKAGCSVFCEGNTPPCSRLFEYMHCSFGEQLASAVKCAIKEYDRPRWEPNAEVHMCV